MLKVDHARACTALRQQQAEKPDLILLDLGLPDIEGHDLLAQWRAGGVDTPVVVLSSRTDEAGIVRALELGADDYVAKPFGMKELLARLRVTLRHRLHQSGERPLFQSGDPSVDLVKRIVRLAGAEVKLSPKEYDILRILVQNAGKVLTHRHLLEKVWLGLRVRDKAVFLAGWSEDAAGFTGLDKGVIFAALSKRKALGSTGVGSGIALPHAAIAGLGTAFSPMVRLGHAIGCGAVDEKPVDLVVLLLTPQNDPSADLTSLPAIARTLRSDGLLTLLRHVATEADAPALWNDAI